ncbi:MAG TPA: hypothetical protein VFZ08_06600 [Terriglobia bacterium]|nr:hypothetical protein [Terriglobia bacterium]
MEHGPIPKVGEAAPDFQLTDSTGREWRLTDCVAEGPRVFVFYRGHW